MLQHVHSVLAYAVLAILILAIINSVLGINTHKNFGSKDRTIALFGLIISHTQLLIGLVLYFTHDKFKFWSMYGMKVMKDANLRQALVEHPITNIIAIVLITIGFSKHKKEESSNGKFKKIGIFYGLGLLLILSRIPWKQWV
jgi:hypothetical protein